MTCLVTKHLREMETGVVLYYGIGRSGKTATAWWDMENTFRDRQKAMWCYPEDRLAGLDDYRRVERISDIEIGDALFMDDTALFLLSRDWKGKGRDEWVRWLTVMSHNDVLLLITIQSLKLLDISVFEPQSLVIIQKRGDSANLRIEREEYRTMLSFGNMMLDAHDCGGVSIKAFSLMHPLLEIRQTPLVPFWSESYSKPYRGVSHFNDRLDATPTGGSA